MKRPSVCRTALEKDALRQDLVVPKLGRTYENLEKVLMEQKVGIEERFGAHYLLRQHVKHQRSVKEW